ncbi:MAG: hypothetical protein P4L77_11805 [Sulfuriferula sp.]|nr:hypothetical protein [Sulfuriferula sp.]
MLSKKVKARIAENRKLKADYPRLLRELAEHNRVEREYSQLGLSQEALQTEGWSSAEVMERHYGIGGGIVVPDISEVPATQAALLGDGVTIDITPQPDEEVQYFEGSQKFKDDFLAIMIRAGNHDFIQLQERNLDFHIFGFLTKKGLARIRMEIFSVIAAPHTTFSMPLKVEDLEKRNTPILGATPYGTLAEVFEADVGVKTYDRFRFLINQNPDVEDALVAFNRSVESGAEKN